MTRTASVLSTLILVTTSVWSFQAQPEGRQQTKPGQNVLWADPGDVASHDFEYGIGGSQNQPQPPFQFVNEDLSGTSKKINVTDARGAKWNIKWGHEARASVFCSRLLWACGYFVETEYFVPNGTITQVHGLQRAASKVSKDGSFTDARFQLRNDSPKYLPHQHWTWKKNPFAGTRELQGLKIMLLLASNWDGKEANLSIFEDDNAGDLRYLYMDDDWGASLGRWGNTFTWEKWDCKGFAEQTSHFVKSGAGGSLQWGFEGKNQKAMTSDITTQDVQWLLQYLGRITDDQLRTGLMASGATPDDVNCFTRSIRQRIEQLQQISADAGSAKR